METPAGQAEWMGSTSRVALAGLLHDLGKLTQRARHHDEGSEAWKSHVTLYCPFYRDKGYHSHLHAAATAMAFDEIETYLPLVLQGDVSPFNARGTGAEVTDSLVNAAAAHHKPDTGLQWCITTADRVASGFERDEFELYNGARDDYLTERLLVPFEEVGRTKKAQLPSDLSYRYPLAPLSASSIFPARRDRKSADTSEYVALWDHLLAGLKQIPAGFRGNWPLWLDAFDALWQSTSHAIPSATAFGTRPDVSLYDHSRAVAAFGAALWRYHAEQDDPWPDFATRQAKRSDWDEHKFLLIQGDFAGIQAFIFGGAGSTQKSAAKLLRGRSALVSLLCEIAALKVLGALELPPTSQIINAAGKFLIVAPNTERTATVLKAVRTKLDNWFIEKTFGLASVVIASEPASCNDFISRQFGALRSRLTTSLERAKRQRYSFGTSDAPDPIRVADYAHGACPYDQRLPADSTDGNGVACASISADQIELGSHLARQQSTILVVEREADVRGTSRAALKTSFFGYKVRICNSPEGLEGAARVFDLSLPGPDPKAPLFRGLARRAINAYVPTLDHHAEADSRYKGIEDVAEVGALKTFEHLARDAQTVDASGKVKGVAALGILKGDIDNLGHIFATAQGEKATFASWAGLSRRVTMFFSTAVPQICAAEPRFHDIYTVFAGGDDFYFIGPWRAMKPFAVTLQDAFSRYCAGNKDIHFSAAYAMVKPGHPLKALSANIELGLDHAKSRPGKNAISLSSMDESVPMTWTRFIEMQPVADELERLISDYRLTTGFLYDVLRFTEMAKQVSLGVVSAARWRAMLAYRTRRHLRDKVKPSDPISAQSRMMGTLAVDGIERFGHDFRHIVSDHLYRERD